MNHSLARTHEPRFCPDRPASSTRARAQALPRLLLAACAAAGLLALVSTSQARECADDSECPKGFTCEQTVNLACPEIACAPDTECEPIECDSGPLYECVSVECDSDDDCAEGMVCHTETWRLCADGCPEGASDEECQQQESACEEQSESSCVPRYALACEADGDCGPGFSCLEIESCGCAGSAGSAGSAEPAPDPNAGDAGGEEMEPQAEPGDSPPPEDAVPQDLEDPNCFCEPTGAYQCELNIVACDTSDDCPEGFECGPNPEGGVCWASSDGDSGCSEPDPAQICLPPYHDLATGRGFSQAAASSGLAGGEAGAPLGSGAATDGSDEPPTAEVDTNDLASGEQGAASDEKAGSESSDSGGCQLSRAPHPAGSGATALGLLMLGAWVSRRRRASNLAGPKT